MEEEVTVDHSNSAGVLALAQSNMIDTFILGASYPTMTTIHSIFVKTLDELADKLKPQNLWGRDPSRYLEKSGGRVFSQ